MKWKTLFISAILFLLPVNLWAAVPASSPDASASQEAWSFLQEAGSRFWEASEEFLEYSGELLEEAGDLFQGFLSEGEEAKEDPARFSLCYFYGQLTEEEKAVYASLYDGLMAGEEKIYLKTGEKEILEKVTQLLLQDHPDPVNGQHCLGHDNKDQNSDLFTGIRFFINPVKQFLLCVIGNHGSGNFHIRKGGKISVDIAGNLFQV